MNLDARTQTAYGTLRSFVRFDMARRTGHFFSGTAQRRGEAEIATGVDFAGKAQTQITLDKAFIQFAGITAGRATSFFDFYSNDLSWARHHRLGPWRDEPLGLHRHLRRRLVGDDRDGRPAGASVPDHRA